MFMAGNLLGFKKNRTSFVKIDIDTFLVDYYSDK